jgi:putative transposase
MSNYKRLYHKGGWYFFTVVTYERRRFFDNPQSVDLLRKAISFTKESHPFDIDAIVVLPDHIHSIWQLPENDDDFSTRWRSIKTYFSKHTESEVNHRGEKLVWQRRFWEHMIKDEEDWRNHLDYIHYNPVKHGLTKRPIDYKFSSFKKCINKGWYPEKWGDTIKTDIADLDVE